MAEILNHCDPRRSSREISKAERKELTWIINCGTFKVIVKAEMPTDCNVLPGRFVPEINSTEAGAVKFTARYVIRGHRTTMKRMMFKIRPWNLPQGGFWLLSLGLNFGCPPSMTLIRFSSFSPRFIHQECRTWVFLITLSVSPNLQACIWPLLRWRFMVQTSSSKGSPHEIHVIWPHPLCCYN